MNDLALYCKSYLPDVLRAAQLAKSIRQHNSYDIPFYLSCPSSDLALFNNIIGTEGVILLADEEIVAANNNLDKKKISIIPSNVSQQIIKSEFWRLGLSENYLCLDSDSYFIRDFGKNDFLHASGAPYTVINESFELRLFGSLHHHAKITRNIDDERRKIMEIFERTDKYYDFGPLPVMWSRRVWSDLAERFLEPKQMSMLDAILLFPSEMRWYGEALLKFKSIELWPVETLFRCYHYESQFYNAKKSGETEEILSQVYLGICRQSAWDQTLRYEQNKKMILSGFARTFKRLILRRLV